MAQRAYAPTAAPIRTDRGTEYEVIARITHRLKAAAENQKRDYPGFMAALHENRSLWTILATDVSDPENELPQDLRARIFYLGEFTNQHTSKVMAGKDSVVPLLEINTAILRGLRAGAEKK